MRQVIVAALLAAGSVLSANAAEGTGCAFEPGTHQALTGVKVLKAFNWAKPSGRGYLRAIRVPHEANTYGIGLMFHFRNARLVLEDGEPENGRDAWACVAKKFRKMDLEVNVAFGTHRGHCKRGGTATSYDGDISVVHFLNLSMERDCRGIDGDAADDGGLP